MESVLVLAQSIAEEAHAGQFRKDGKTPYITHPEAVANSFPEDLTLHRSVAWLHDVIEDTHITAAELIKRGIPQAMVRRIEMLTKDKNTSYLEYILHTKEDDIVKDVKIADIKHNMSTLEPKNKTMRDKYMMALYVLEH